MNLVFRTVEIFISVILVFHAVNTREFGSGQWEWDEDYTKPVFEHGIVSMYIITYITLICRIIINNFSGVIWW